MKNINITKLEDNKNAPYDLLNLADPSIDKINEYLYNGDCYVAYINNEIVGAYILISIKQNTNEIVNISVKESFQNMGIGKKLIKSAIKISKESGAKILEVGTGNSSISQLAFYQKCGFRIVDIYKDFFRINYSEKIIENGIECMDMIRLSLNL